MFGRAAAAVRPRSVKLLVAVGSVLAVSPPAHADSILFATDHVPVPVRVMQIGIDGRGARTLATTTVLDRGADGALLTTDDSQRTLLVDGRAVARVDWPIDEARFSPDGREIAFTSPSMEPSPPQGSCEEYCQRWQLWLVGRDGSGLRQLSLDGRAPRFSPDGRRLAYLQGPRGESAGGYLTVLELATGATTGFGFVDANPPSWSPRSDELAYSTYGTGSFGSVFVATLSPRRATRRAGRGEAPLFSPDGRSIAYVSRAGLTVQQLVSGRTVVVAPAAQVAYDLGTDTPPRLAWCGPRWLVYAAITRTSPFESEQVFRVRADGTHRGPLTSFEPNTEIAWLESRGTTLIFEVSRDRRDLATIDAVDLSSGTVTQLTHDAGDDRSPTLARQGTLAYAKGVPGQYGRYCPAVDGRCLRPAAAGIAAEPASWSPDGRRLALLDAVRGGIDLSVVDASTGAVRVVHDFRDYVVRSSIHGNTAVVGGVYTNDVSSPSWSPDGTAIVVASDQPDANQDGPPRRFHLWLARVASGTTTELAPDTPGTDPSWSPDGDTIAFSGYQQESAGAIELYDVATGTVAPLVSPASNGAGAEPVQACPGCRVAWSPDSSQLAYQAPDGSLHVIRRDGSGDREVVPYAVPGGSIAWRR
jgi:Tol biopolymer transport system component